jgi:hypothetical protein
MIKKYLNEFDNNEREVRVDSFLGDNKDDLLYATDESIDPNEIAWYATFSSAEVAIESVGRENPTRNFWSEPININEPDMGYRVWVVDDYGEQIGYITVGQKLSAKYLKKYR